MDTRPDMTTTEQARKFLFDLSFDDGRNKFADEKDKPKPTYSQEQLDAEKEQSFAQGLDMGRQEAQASQQKQIADVLAHIDRQVAEVIEASQDEWQKQLAQMQEVALVIARKIMPKYVEQNGLGEVEAIVAKVIGEMGREPRLVFRVNETQFDALNEKINTLAKQAAYAGKLVILGDPEMGLSDCRIEWADGGIERDLRKIWQDIDRVMEAVQTFEDPAPEAAPQVTLTQTETTDSNVSGEQS